MNTRHSITLALKMMTADVVYLIFIQLQQFANLSPINYIQKLTKAAKRGFVLWFILQPWTLSTFSLCVSV